MSQIEKREKEIRNLINNPWKQQSLLEDTVQWNKICASLDVIGDTQIAIENYFRLPNSEIENSGYLFLYGLLQAFFLQQDAVSHLSEALFKEAIDWENEYPEIYTLRDLRNDSIGHPTKRGKDRSFHFISRISISKEQFQLMSYKSSDDEPSFKMIDLNKFMEIQEKGVNKILVDVVETMTNEYSKHKSRFSNRKLIDLIPNTFDYSMQKVFEGIHNGHALADVSLKEILQTIANIKIGINDRYGQVSILPGLNDLINRIDYILNRLKSWSESKELMKNNDAEVFWDGFSDRFRELKIMLSEIDNEFR